MLHYHFIQNNFFLFFIQVQIRTNRGLRKAYVQKVDKAILAKGMNVVVKREGGIYEEGVVRCFRFPIGELVVGIELGEQSKNMSIITYSIITVPYYIQCYCSTLLHTVLLQYFITYSVTVVLYYIRYYLFNYSIVLEKIASKKKIFF